MLQPTSTRKIKGFLDVLGYQWASTNGTQESWSNGKNSVIFGVNEEIMPISSIEALLRDLEEEPLGFVRITSVIN